MVAGSITSPYDPVINTLGPAALDAYKRTGIDPVILLAIPVNEVGAGYVSNPMQNPLYGVKDFGGGGTLLPTIEYNPNTGQMEQTVAPFFLGTAVQQIDNFINLVSNSPNYADAWANRSDPVKFLQGLMQGGYATDPDWPTKVMAIYNEIMPRFTGGGGASTPTTPTTPTQPTGGGVNTYPGLYVPDIGGSNILEVLINALKALIAPIVQIATFFRTGTTFLVWLANPINWARAILVAIGIGLVAFGTFMLIRTF